MRSPGRPLAIAAIAGSLLVAGCTDHDPQPLPPGTNSRGIDVATYYEDYESPEYGDDMAMSGTAAEASVGGVEVPMPVPGPLEDNTFVDAGTSGFVDAATDAESTFALDVDTGSWNVARTLLGDHFLPTPESIRVEEWVNAQPTDLPEPEESVGVSTDTALAPTLDDGTQLVRVGVNTRSLTVADRRPVNVTMVVDRSGSMDIRERLGLVQSSLAILADSLRDDDTVSIVSFEDSARPLLEPTPASDTDAILAAIDELEPGGSTNLEAGLKLGYSQARETYSEDATSVVVLASDGVANVGRTGPGSIVDQIQTEGAQGIHLVTVGYGMGNYNDHLMEQLADLGDGFYAYVDDLAEAERLFRDQLATALVPVASEARAQVAFDPDLVSSYRLIGYDNRAIADDDFTDDTIDAGELGAGHHATALYEVQLADGVEPGAVIGTATARWTPIGRGPAREASADVTAGGGEPAGSFALAALVADVAQLLKGAAPFADRPVSLADLDARAAALEEAGVKGAAAVRDLVGQALAIETR